MNQLTDQAVVGVAGSWGTDPSKIALAMATFGMAGVDTVIHTGTLGLDDGRVLDLVDRAAARHGLRVYVTISSDDFTPSGVRWDVVTEPEWVRGHVAVLPKVWRGTVAGRRVLCVGGGGRAAAAVTDADMLEVIVGGPADLMISHDAPYGATYAVAARPQDAAAGRHQLTEAWLQARPQLLVHGHHEVTAHEMVVPETGEPTQVVALNRIGVFGNMALVDLSGAVPHARFVDAQVPGQEPVSA